MYEEEDDELPSHYRRLTAHLQTDSNDFNRRLSAYLTNHVAMRSALDQVITSSYAQQYPNAPQFAHNHQSMYPSPFMAHHMPQQQALQSYVQPPYNAATGTPSYRPVQHFRSASISGPQETSGFNQNIPTSSPVQGTNPIDQRRMSMPAKPTSPTASVQTPQFSQARPTPPRTSSSSFNGKHPTTPFFPVKQEDQSPSQMSAPPQPQPQPQPHQRNFGNFGSYQDLGPFTTALPMESQLMLGSVLDPNDPLTAAFMSGSENMMHSYYNANPAALSKQRNFHPSYDGMSATLAPSALDMSTPSLSNPPPVTSAALSNSPFPFDFEGSMFDFTKGQSVTRSNSSHGSGTATPGIDGGWDAFINENAV